MIDVFRVGVHLGMTSNAPQLLGVIARHFAGIHADAKQLEKQLGKVSLAVGGVVSAMAGIGLVKGVWHAVEASRELNRELDRTAQLGRKLKIDPAALKERFLGARTLVLTGERAEESPSRARYAALEPHRSDTRDGTRRRRYIDHWRPVHGYAEMMIWDLIRRHRITPAIPYQLGFGRLSCMGCIFGSADHFATIRVIAPAWFDRLARYEQRLGCTGTWS